MCQGGSPLVLVDDLELPGGIWRGRGGKQKRDEIKLVAVSAYWLDNTIRCLMLPVRIRLVVTEEAWK